MIVLAIQPGKMPEQVELDGSLESMQAFVGGSIQAVYPFSDPVAIVCNDEGKLLGLEHNRALRDEAGNVYARSSSAVWAKRTSPLCRKTCYRNTQNAFSTRSCS